MAGLNSKSPTNNGGEDDMHGRMYSDSPEI
jgi:hypothetical protein